MNRIVWVVGGVFERRGFVLWGFSNVDIELVKEKIRRE